MKFAIFAAQSSPVLEQSLARLKREHGDLLLQFFSAAAQQQDMSVDSELYLVESMTAFSAEHFDLVLAFEPLSQELNQRLQAAGLPCLQLCQMATPLVFGVNEDLLSEKSALLQAQPTAYIANGAQFNVIKLLAVLKQHYGLSAVYCAVLQSLSDYHAAAVEALAGQTARLLNGLGLEDHEYPQQLAFNSLPGASLKVEASVAQTLSRQENELLQAVGDALGDDFVFSASFTALPVFYGDTFELNVELGQDVELDSLRLVLEEQGYLLASDEQDLITPASHAGELEQAAISRLRYANTSKDIINISLVVDNVRNGAALNTFELVNFLIKHVL